MRKIKSLKGKTLKKTSFVELDNGIVLPLKTLSITEDKLIQLRTQVIIPRKLRPATEEEIDLLAKSDPAFNAKTRPMISEYDVESEEYLEYADRQSKLQRILNIIKYVDMDYKVEDENGNEITLWEDLNILDNGIVLPLKTLSITEDKLIQLRTQVIIPRKLRPATEEEIDLLAKSDPAFNAKTRPMISEYDVESEEYLEYADRQSKLQRILNIIKYVDMDYKVEDENGNEITLWEDLNITEGDWESVCAYFGDVLELTEKDLTEIYKEIKIMEKETVFEQFDKFQKLANKYNMFELLTLCEKVYREENVENGYLKHLVDDAQEKIESIENSTEE